jgi:hypothetical protein
MCGVTDDNSCSGVVVRGTFDRDEREVRVLLVLLLKVLRSDQVRDNGREVGVEVVY